MDSYRMEGGQSRRPGDRGMNHPGGVMVHFLLTDWTDTTEVKLSFHEEDGTLIQSFSTKANEKKDKLELRKGANRFVWDTRYPGGEDFKGMVLWWASLRGPKAVPGKYQVKLAVGEKEEVAEFEILQDPRSPVSKSDIQTQFDFVQELLDKVTEAHQTIEEIRDIRTQLNHFTGRLKGRENMEPLFDKAQAIDSALTIVEESLYQTQNRSNQDPLNFPIRLTNKLASLNSLIAIGDYPPTKQAIAVRDELIQEIDAQLQALEQVKEKELPAFNNLLVHYEAGGVILKE
jgi:hypothetical protein